MALWTPNNLPAGTPCIGWFEVTLAAQVTAVSGNFASCNNQASSSSVTLAQTTSARRPAFTANTGVTIGSTQSMVLGNLPTGVDLTFLIVGTPTGTNYCTFLSDVADTNNEVTVAPAANGSVLQVYNDTTNGNIGSLTWTRGNLGMTTTVIPNSGNVSANRDGSDPLSTSTTSFTKSANINVGNFTAGSEFFGLIKLVMVVQGIMSTSDRQKLEGWAAWAQNIGMNGNMVAGFPYNSAPPTTGTDIAASPGSFAITGQSATINQAIAASSGAFAITGKPATFTQATTIAALPGSFAITGKPATFAISMAAGPGSFAINGQAATINTTGTTNIAALPGSFIITGKPATITTTGTTTISAPPGSFIITGQAATINTTTTTVVAASPGSFAIAGQPATISTLGPLWTSVIGGVTPGSQLTATSSDGTLLTINGNVISGQFTKPGFPIITVTERFIGSPNSPKTTSFTLSVS